MGTVSTDRTVSEMCQVSSVQRGHNIGIGRIEAAFARSKERGENAFITFVTAGFPHKHGELNLLLCF